MYFLGGSQADTSGNRFRLRMEIMAGDRVDILLTNVKLGRSGGNTDLVASDLAFPSHPFHKGPLRPASHFNEKLQVPGFLKHAYNTFVRVQIHVLVRITDTGTHVRTHTHTHTHTHAHTHTHTDMHTRARVHASCLLHIYS